MEYDLEFLSKDLKYILKGLIWQVFYANIGRQILDVFRHRCFIAVVGNVGRRYVLTRFVETLPSPGPGCVFSNSFFIVRSNPLHCYYSPCSTITAVERVSRMIERSKLASRALCEQEQGDNMSTSNIAYTQICISFFTTMSTFQRSRGTGFASSIGIHRVIDDNQI
jgi:hypothetical protein